MQSMFDGALVEDVAAEEDEMDPDEFDLNARMCVKRGASAMGASKGLL